MRIILAFLSMFLLHPLWAQPTLPDPGWIYTDSTVPQVDIWIDADSLAAIYVPGNERSDHEFTARFAFTRDGQSDTIEQVGFRLRGNSSRFARKKSFKVSINGFIPGRKFHGVEKLNLNGEHNDPAIIRAKLCWDLERAMGLPSPRANHVTVYINGRYYGLYINVEHIDDEFVQEYFGTDAGNLYKCLFPADLSYIDNNPDSYSQLMTGTRPVYELKTNEQTADFSGLVHFIDVLNNEPSATFECAIEEVFNVDAYLRSLAVEIFTGHWDNLVYNRNNFYLFENPETGKMEYISYDMDNTFGVDWIGGDWAKRDIYNWDDPGDTRPIYHRLLSVQRYRNQFTAYFKELLQYTLPSTYYPHINRLMANAQPWAAIDSFYQLDYGYLPADFTSAYTQAKGNHVKYGIKPYIEIRTDSAWAQLENINAVPSYQWVDPSFTGVNDSFRVHAGVWDEAMPVAGNLHYRYNGEPWQLVSGKIRPSGIYWAIPPFHRLATIEWYLVVTDQAGQEGRYPCRDFETLDFTQLPPIRINEFMADNDNFLQDEAGDYEDWLEIYNAASVEVSLTGFTLTDDLGQPGKWPLPDTTIPAGGFMLVWADDEGSEGPLHANFKLAKGGEEIGLFFAASHTYLPVDTLTFGPQATDLSQGCYPDGIRPIRNLDPPTPGASNINTIPSPPGLVKIKVWPNPVRDQFWLEVETTDHDFVEIKLVDLTGRVALEKKAAVEPSIRVDLPPRINPGLWLLQIVIGSDNNEAKTVVTKKIVVW